MSENIQGSEDTAAVYSTGKQVSPHGIYILGEEDRSCRVCTSRAHIYTILFLAKHLLIPIAEKAPWPVLTKSC